jgi:hypothetical protein
MGTPLDLSGQGTVPLSTSCLGEWHPDFDLGFSFTGKGLHITAVFIDSVTLVKTTMSYKEVTDPKIQSLIYH